MSTGTIQDPAVQVIQNLRHDALQHGFTNSEGAALSKGDEVYLDTDGSVKLRDAATQVPIGVVVVGAADGERVTVRDFFTMELNVVNGGAGAINPGQFVVPLGTKDSDGYPEYDAAAAGNYSCAIVINGGAAGESMRIGILDSLHVQQ